MVELGVGRPDNPITCLSDAQTEIYIAVRYRQISLVEATDLIEHYFRHHQARGGHRGEILYHCSTAVVTEISAWRSMRDMPSNAPEAEDNPAMLDGVIGI